MNITLPPHIEDTEQLYRAFPGSNPNLWKADLKRFTSAIFKDSLGCSVDRDGGRSEETIIEVFAERKPGFGLACIIAGDCREEDAHLVAKPEEDNPYHAEIHNSKSSVEITSKGKARRLAKKTHLVKYPEQ